MKQFPGINEAHFGQPRLFSNESFYCYPEKPKTLKHPQGRLGGSDNGAAFGALSGLSERCPQTHPSHPSIPESWMGSATGLFPGGNQGCSGLSRVRAGSSHTGEGQSWGFRANPAPPPPSRSGRGTRTWNVRGWWGQPWGQEWD